MRLFGAVGHRGMTRRISRKNLSLSEGAARVAVHRMRKRFRELYREEITHTLPDQADLDAEMRHLAGVLAQA